MTYSDTQSTKGRSHGEGKLEERQGGGRAREAKMTVSELHRASLERKNTPLDGNTDASRPGHWTGTACDDCGARLQWW